MDGVQVRSIEVVVPADGIENGEWGDIPMERVFQAYRAFTEGYLAEVFSVPVADVDVRVEGIDTQTVRVELEYEDDIEQAGVEEHLDSLVAKGAWDAWHRSSGQWSAARLAEGATSRRDADMDTLLQTMASMLDATNCGQGRDCDTSAAQQAARQVAEGVTWRKIAPYFAQDITNEVYAVDESIDDRLSGALCGWVESQPSVSRHLGESGSIECPYAPACAMIIFGSRE